MKRKLLFVVVLLIQATFICAFIALLSIKLREHSFDHAVRIGWPFVFFHAFDVGNPTLNHGADVGNLVCDYVVAVFVSIPIVAVYRKLLRQV